MQTDHLSYASPMHPLWKRAFIRAVENASGRRRLLPIYARWCETVAGKSPRMMGDMLSLIGTRLDIEGDWPPNLAPTEPVVMVANHPFGIADGIALTVLAEALGRPYRILVNKDFLSVPEVRDIVLPIDFDETPEAVETNLATRAEARRLLAQGVTLVIFPAGGVATSERLFGRVEELPWKTFVARLVQASRATVLPVFVEGRNSTLFQMASRVSLTLRLALLVSEFRRSVGARLSVHVGHPVPFAALENPRDRRALTDELYARVHQQHPENRNRPIASLRPRAASERRRFPWDRPSRPVRRRISTVT
jgi:putative hemolysin